MSVFISTWFVREIQYDLKMDVVFTVQVLGTVLACDLMQSCHTVTIGHGCSEYNRICKLG